VVYFKFILDPELPGSGMIFYGSVSGSSSCYKSRIRLDQDHRPTTLERKHQLDMQQVHRILNGKDIVKSGGKSEHIKICTGSHSKNYFTIHFPRFFAEIMVSTILLPVSRPNRYILRREVGLFFKVRSSDLPPCC
jgi:hypothetical protein